MEKKLEKSIEKKIGKELGEEIKKDVEKEVKKEVQKEVKKRLPELIFQKTRDSAMNFRREFRKQTVVAISAGFAFLVALSWRNPIEATANGFVQSLGLVGKEIYIEYLSAIVITVVAVLVLMWLSKWNVKD